MAKPVNLNRVRKDKARADQKARANENSAKFGRTKAQKALEQTEAATRVTALDQHKREP